MSNREVVAGVLARLPEDAPLEDIAREIELLAGIQTARAQVRRGECISIQEAYQSVNVWCSPFAC